MVVLGEHAFLGSVRVVARLKSGAPQDGQSRVFRVACIIEVLAALSEDCSFAGDNGFQVSTCIAKHVFQANKVIPRERFAGLPGKRSSLALFIKVSSRVVSHIVILDARVRLNHRVDIVRP